MLFRYGRDLNSVLKDNLGDNWDEVCCFPKHLPPCVYTRHLLVVTSILIFKACVTLMTEMRMYELECLRWVEVQNEPL